MEITPYTIFKHLKTQDIQKMDKYTKIHMRVAEEYAKLSHAKRLKCGSLLVSSDNKRILSIGYNGTPTKHDNRCEELTYKCKCDSEDFLVIVKNGDSDIFVLNPNNEQNMEYFYNNIKDMNKEVKISCNKCSNIENISFMNLLKTKQCVIHAEANLISYCARHGIPTEGNIIYITHSPCIECAKLIIAAGIKKVVYKHTYRSTDGLELLSKENDIIIEHCQDSE